MPTDECNYRFIPNTVIWFLPVKCLLLLNFAHKSFETSCTIHFTTEGWSLWLFSVETSTLDISKQFDRVQKKNKNSQIC